MRVCYSAPMARDIQARAGALRAEHDRLCFLRAFPRTHVERRRAERALAEFEARVVAIREQLKDSGIAGTTYSYPYNYRLSRWMSETYGRAVSVDWNSYKRADWDELAGLLSLLTGWAEMDGVDDEDTGSWDWVRAACSHDRRGGLAWILRRLRAATLPAEVERHLYESAGLPLLWDLAGCPDSITHLALSVRRPFTSREILRGRPADFAAAVREPVGPLEIVAPRRAIRYIRAARASLSLREREFHVIVHANPQETYRTRCGRGLEIITFGLPKQLRLPLEADYGCLLLRNGVTIGYAYGAVLFDRCDIGINIFPTYRSGESTFAFTKVAALFRQHFGSRVFIVRRYQIGHGNPEGIEAGAFWFYWKLGFRSIAPRIRSLAEREEKRLARRRGARSDATMLRRLARSDVVWHAEGLPVAAFRDYDVAAVGRAVTRLIEQRYGGDRDAAEEDSARRVARALGVERVARRLAPIAAGIRGLEHWPEGDKSRLAAVLRSKFARRERGYVGALIRAERFRRCIEAYGNGGPTLATNLAQGTFARPASGRTR